MNYMLSKPTKHPEGWAVKVYALTEAADSAPVLLATAYGANPLEAEHRAKIVRDGFLASSRMLG